MNFEQMIAMQLQEGKTLDEVCAMMTEAANAVKKQQEENSAKAQKLADLEPVCAALNGFLDKWYPVLSPAGKTVKAEELLKMLDCAYDEIQGLKKLLDSLPKLKKTSSTTPKEAVKKDPIIEFLEANGLNPIKRGDKIPY